VFGKSEQLNAALMETVRAGLIVCVNGSYAFLHDRVREAAYALIPESERVAAHARIGRAAAAHSAPEDLEEKIFEIVNQFNRGSALITTRQEREYVAELNLIAGKRAKMSAAYESAVTYLSAGRSLLGEDRWEGQYRLAFALEYQQADCELLSADFAGAEQRLSMLMRRAENLRDRASVTRLLASLHTILNRNDRTTEICLEYLRSVGIDWSAHPTADEVRQEYKRIAQSLGSRAIEDLIQLPAMTQPDCRATIDVLTSIAPPGILTDRNLHRLVVGRMVNLTLENGNSDGACVAYVLWGMILGSHFGEYDAGFRFGKLGLELVERPGLDRFKARVYVDFATVVNPWSGRLGSGLALLRQAFNTAQETGDLTFTAYSCNNLVTHLLAIGARLDDIRAEADNGIEFARKTRFNLVREVITGQLLLIRALQGLTPGFSFFNDEEFDEARFEHHLEEDRRLAVATCSYWIRKLQARFYANEYASAIEAAAKAQRLLWASPSPFGETTLPARLSHGLELAEYHFYSALAHAAMHNDAASLDERSQRLETLRHHHRQLAAWAESCAETFANRAALVGAELARIEGRELDAERLYERAILSARKHGFIQNEGTANEAAALFYAARGFETIAATYLRNARYCYQRWGAAGKVKQLDQRYPQLLRAEQDPSSHSSTIGTPVAQLDVGTVVKASQAVSGEIVLDRLIETLMKIALEHAGANRGMLILLRDDALRIEAEAEAGPRSIDVRIRQAAVTSAELPTTLLQTVARTRGSVIIDDAHRTNPFAHDAYIRRRQPRSVLCLALVKQAQLIGLLYLENSLTLGTFTPERTAVLELLASQAAISLENARLYAELSGENRERRKVEEALRASEASLAEGQQFSHTGNFRTNVRTDEIRASAEYFRIHDLDPAVAPRFQVSIRERVHPDDWPLLVHALDQAVIENSGFQCEYRLVMPDGSIKHLQSVGRATTGEAGDVELAGTVMDITERKRADDALRSTQLELAHLTRVVTLGELAASIAHEVNQPLAAIVSNGEAGLRWLRRNPPELDEVRASLEAMIRDGLRAGEVVHRIRGLAKKADSQKALVDINACIQEIIPLIQHELAAQRVSLQLRLSPMLPPVLGDKVQLQQVIINLIVNGIEAMTAVTDRQRELVIRSGENETNVLVAIQDCGVGIDAESEAQLFDAFFTTKPGGLGMGLSICRSIIEAHLGRLWASGHAGVGATFQFTLPIHRDNAQ
jgi:C4-dicarboxylate-specific signal transduction histidine kinase